MSTSPLPSWDEDKLVGIARSMTDFHYACYLSDLAVDVACQHSGIRRKLIRLTRQALGPRCKLRLISAPAAAGYYPKLGGVRNEQCWELAPSSLFLMPHVSDVGGQNSWELGGVEMGFLRII